MARRIVGILLAKVVEYQAEYVQMIRDALMSFAMGATVHAVSNPACLAIFIGSRRQARWLRFEPDARILIDF